MITFENLLTVVLCALVAGCVMLLMAGMDPGPGPGVSVRTVKTIEVLPDG